jgi:hypothetical protein
VREDRSPTAAGSVAGDAEKNASRLPDAEADETDYESINKDLQDGVARVEGITAVWSFRTLIVAYVL